MTSFITCDVEEEDPEMSGPPGGFNMRVPMLRVPMLTPAGTKAKDAGSSMWRWS